MLPNEVLTLNNQHPFFLIKLLYTKIHNFDPIHIQNLYKLENLIVLQKILFLQYMYMLVFQSFLYLANNYQNFLDTDNGQKNLMQNSHLFELVQHNPLLFQRHDRINMYVYENFVANGKKRQFLPNLSQNILVCDLKRKDIDYDTRK